MVAPRAVVAVRYSKSCAPYRLKRFAVGALPAVWHISFEPSLFQRGVCWPAVRWSCQSPTNAVQCVNVAAVSVTIEIGKWYPLNQERTRLNNHNQLQYYEIPVGHRAIIFTPGQGGLAGKTGYIPHRPLRRSSLVAPNQPPFSGFGTCSAAFYSPSMLVVCVVILLLQYRTHEMLAGVAAVP